MENIEILGFQFEPSKALQPDSSSGESWKTCSTAGSEPSNTRRNEESFDTWWTYFNEGVLVL